MYSLFSADEFHRATTAADSSEGVLAAPPEWPFDTEPGHEAQATNKEMQTKTRVRKT